MITDRLIVSMLREEGGFQRALLEILEQDLNMNLSQFCSVSGISMSTMYKIMEADREPNLRTIRHIFKSLTILSKEKESRFVAVIASPSFATFLPESIETGVGEIKIRDYPVSTMEDALVAAIRAERDGALAIVCAPILKHTLEKVLSIKVVPIKPLGSVLKAIDEIKNDF